MDTDTELGRAYSLWSSSVIHLCVGYVSSEAVCGTRIYCSEFPE